MKPVIVKAEDRPKEGWDDPRSTSLSWVTLFSGDLTPTSGLTAGVAEIAPGESALRLHRHTQAEIYYILAGEGQLTVDGEATRVEAGAAVFIPGDAEHGLRNTGPDLLRLLYVFPTDRFSDVVYRFSEE